MTKHTIFAAALFAFCSPAFAGGGHGGGHYGGAIGGTSANSFSGAAVASCGPGCPTKSAAQAIGGNTSYGYAEVGPHSQQSLTGSESYGAGNSYNGHYTGGGGGDSSAYTFGRF